MKIKNLFKKGFTLLETVIVIAVVAILAGASVGIYFGVMNQNPEEDATSKQDLVLDLWKNYLNNGFDYSSLLENKVHEFCTGYVEEKGVDVKLNYRVLQFDKSINSIINDQLNNEPQSKIQRAYDPSHDTKELAFIKIETTYPSYFISTVNSVIEVTKPYELEKDLIESIYNNIFVEESHVKEYFEKDYSPEVFSDYFFDLSDINVNGETVRGVRYVRYDVYNGNNKEEVELYTTVYGKANRTLNQEAGGTYTPGISQSDNFGGNINPSIILSDKFVLSEVKEDGKYLYDPNHLYDCEDNEYKSDLQTEANKLSTSKKQYIVSQKDITFESTLAGGTVTDAVNPGDKDSFPDVDIANPIDPDNDPVITDPSVVDPTEYPITLFFASKVKPSIENGTTFEKVVNWLKRLFGIYDDSFKFLFFKDFKTLNLFINSEEFQFLVPTGDDGNDTRKVVFVNGQEVILDHDITFGDDFIFTMDYVDMEGIGSRANEHQGWFDKYKDDLNRGIAGSNRSYVYSKSSSARYSSTFGKNTNSLIIPPNKSLSFKDGAQMFVEGDITGVEAGRGFEIRTYGSIENNGVITFDKDCGARVTGKIEGNGKIIVNNGATITEPFKVTDYTGKNTSNSEFVNKKSFYSDFYYLDAIQCKLTLMQGSTYNLFIPFYALIDDGAFEYDSTCFTDFTFFGPSNSNTIFTSSDKSVVVKTFNNNVSTFDVECGNISYNNIEFDSDWEVYYMGIIRYTNTRTNIKGTDKFNTSSVGFKLSNMNLNMKKGTTLSMTQGNNKLEVLPGSSIKIEEHANLVLNNNASLIVTDFFGNSKWKNNIYSQTGNSYLLQNYNKLESTYSSCSYMLTLDGNVSYLDNGKHLTIGYETSFIYTKEECKHTNKKCHSECGTGWLQVTRSCKEEYVTSRHYSYAYAVSAIFAWTYDLIENNTNGLFYKDTFNSDLKTITEQKDETHVHTQDNCPNKYTTYKIPFKTTYEFNTYKYKNYSLPAFELRPVV